MAGAAPAGSSQAQATVNLARDPTPQMSTSSPVLILKMLPCLRLVWQLVPSAHVGGQLLLGVPPCGFQHGTV